MSYSNEFPSFGELASPLATALAAGTLHDISWCNDVCPSFIRSVDKWAEEAGDLHATVPVLWADFADPSEREFPEMKRYRVCVPSSDEVGEGTCFETEDANEALAYLLALPVNKPTLADRFASLGFTLRETGGGCTAWELPLARGLSLLVTDDGQAPQVLTDPATLFTMSSLHGEELSAREFASTEELLATLEVSVTKD